jgi:hypothetical protein
MAYLLTSLPMPLTKIEFPPIMTPMLELLSWFQLHHLIPQRLAILFM